MAPLGGVQFALVRGGVGGRGEAGEAGGGEGFRPRRGHRQDGCWP